MSAYDRIRRAITEDNPLARPLTASDANLGPTEWRRAANPDGAEQVVVGRNLLVYATAVLTALLEEGRTDAVGWGEHEHARMTAVRSLLISARAVSAAQPVPPPPAELYDNPDLEEIDIAALASYADMRRMFASGPTAVTRTTAIDMIDSYVRGFIDAAEDARDD